MNEDKTKILKKALYRKGQTPEAEFGKLPPQVTELEEAVLGAVMIEAQAMFDVVEILKSPDDFYVGSHRLIWKACQQLFHAHTNIDLLTVTEQLRRNGDLEAAGGAFFVSQLTNKIGSAANVEYHARIVLEKSLARRLINVSTQATNFAYDDTTDIFELIDSTGSEIEAINLDLSGQGQKSFSDIVAGEYQVLKEAQRSGNTVTGLPTFTSLDRALLGLQPDNLIILAGRPAMGKTSVAWQMALNQARNNIPVGFFSLEMSNRQLIHKLISAEIGVNSHNVRSANMQLEEWQRLDTAVGHMCSYPIYMNDTGGISLLQLQSVARNWVRKHGVKVIYIDYIGKITCNDKKFGSREQEISHISGSIKNLAKQLHIPIVLLSQLSRKVEDRGGEKKPQLSDLRDSGAIEQDADIVLFPYRPEYYGFTNDSDGNTYPKGYTQIIIAKYREGEPNTKVNWIYEAEFSRFEDLNNAPF